MVLDYDPEVMILIPCSFTTARTIVEANVLSANENFDQITAVSSGNVYAADGRIFSSSGPRLFDALENLGTMIHPELFDGQLQTEHGVRLSCTTS